MCEQDRVKSLPDRCALLCNFIVVEFAWEAPVLL